MGSAGDFVGQWRFGKDPFDRKDDNIGDRVLTIERDIDAESMLKASYTDTNTDMTPMEFRDIMLMPDNTSLQASLFSAGEDTGWRIFVHYGKTEDASNGTVTVRERLVSFSWRGLVGRDRQNGNWTKITAPPAV